MTQDSLVFLLDTQVRQVQGLKLVKHSQRPLGTDDAFKSLVHECSDGRLPCVKVGQCSDMIVNVMKGHFTTVFWYMYTKH